MINIDVMKTSQLKGVSFMASELFLSPLRVREERKGAIRKPLVSEYLCNLYCKSNPQIIYTIGLGFVLFFNFFLPELFQEVVS